MICKNASQDQCCLLASTDNVVGLGLHSCKSCWSILLASIWYNSVHNSWYQHFSVTLELHSSWLYYKIGPHIRTVHVQPWSTFTFRRSANIWCVHKDMIPTIQLSLDLIPDFLWRTEQEAETIHMWRMESLLLPLLRPFCVQGCLNMRIST